MIQWMYFWPGLNGPVLDSSPANDQMIIRRNADYTRGRHGKVQRIPLGRYEANRHSTRRRSTSCRTASEAVGRE